MTSFLARARGWSGDFRQTPICFRIGGLERLIVPILTSKTKTRLLRALSAWCGVVRGEVSWRRTRGGPCVATKGPEGSGATTGGQGKQPGENRPLLHREAFPEGETDARARFALWPLAPRYQERLPRAAEGRATGRARDAHCHAHSDGDYPGRHRGAR